MTSLPTSPLVPTSQEKINSLETWRQENFGKVIRAVGITASIAYFAYMALNYQTLALGLSLAYTFAYIFIIIAAFAPRLSTVYRIYIFVSIIFAVGIVASMQYAAIGDGRIWLILAIFLSVVFLGRKAGLAFTIAATLAWGLMGYLFTTSIIQRPEATEQFTFPIWAGITVSLFIVGIIITLSANALLINLSRSVEKSSLLAKKSEEQTKQVERQRKALERRSDTLEASAKISRQLASLNARQEIVDQTPKLLQAEFDLSSVAVFLLDAENALQLASCSDWNEQAHATRDYALSLDEDIVGRAVLSDRAYTNTERETRLKMALPETQSYAAIPLRGRNTILGVLVLQSEIPNDFDAESVSVFQILADQVAILLENAELLIQRENAIESERRAYGEITQAAWEDFINLEDYDAYRRDKKGLTLVPAKPYRSQEKRVESEQVPIRIRGKIVGYIDASKSENRAWSASEKELLSILASRLETAMDSARLYQDSQQRAEREQIISKTSARMRETLNIEGVLETAALELRNALGIAEAKIWISADQSQNIDADAELDAAELGDGQE